MVNFTGFASALLIGVLPMTTSLAQSQASISALVNAEHHVELSAGRAGLLTYLSAELGEEVQKDAVVARFECSIEDARILAAEVEIDAARGEFDLQTELQKRGAGGAALVRRAEIALKMAQAQHVVAKAEAGTCVLKAPFSGVIAAVAARAHETVPLGAPILTLLDPSSVKIDLVLPSAWMEAVEIGARFEFQSTSSQTRHAAQITHLAPFVDPASQTITAQAVFLFGHDLPRAGTAGVAHFDLSLQN